MGIIKPVESVRSLSMDNIKEKIGKLKTEFSNTKVVKWIRENPLKFLFALTVLATLIIRPSLAVNFASKATQLAFAGAVGASSTIVDELIKNRENLSKLWAKCFGKKSSNESTDEETGLRNKKQEAQKEETFEQVWSSAVEDNAQPDNSEVQLAIMDTVWEEAHPKKTEENVAQYEEQVLSVESDKTFSAVWDGVNPPKPEAAKIEPIISMRLPRPSILGLSGSGAQSNNLEQLVNTVSYRNTLAETRPMPTSTQINEQIETKEKEEILNLTWNQVMEKSNEDLQEMVWTQVQLKSLVGEGVKEMQDLRSQLIEASKSETKENVTAIDKRAQIIQPKLTLLIKLLKTVAVPHSRF